MNTTNKVIVAYIQFSIYELINRLGINDTNDQKHYKYLYKKPNMLFDYNKYFIDRRNKVVSFT